MGVLIGLAILLSRRPISKAAARGFEERGAKPLNQRTTEVVLALLGLVVMTYGVLDLFGVIGGGDSADNGTPLLGLALAGVALIIIIRGVYRRSR